MIINKNIFIRTTYNLLKKPWFQWLFLLLVTFFLRSVNYLVITWRSDEFVYATAGSVIVHGGIPYKNFGDIKPPLIYYIYALVDILSTGNKTWYMYVLKTLVTLTAYGTAVFIFVTGKNLFSRRTGLFAAFLFAGFSTCMNRTGEVLPGNTEFFSSIFAAGGLALLTEQKDTFRYFRIFMSGLLVSLAALTNTRTGVFLVIMFLWLWLQKKSWIGLIKEGGTLCAGFLVPVLGFILYFTIAYALKDLLFWQNEMTKYYLDEFSWLMRIIRGGRGYLFFFALIPLLFFCVLYLKEQWQTSPKNSDFIFLAGMFLLTYLSVYASGKHMERYYFTTFIPLCLMGAAGLDGFLTQLGEIKRPALKVSIGWLILITLSVPALLYFHKNFWSVSRDNPEAETIGVTEQYYQPLIEYIRTETAPGEPIFVWPEGELMYFYSDRPLSTPFYSPAQHLLQGVYVPDKQAADRIFAVFFNALAAMPPKLIMDRTDGFQYNRDESNEYIDIHVAQMRQWITEHYDTITRIRDYTIYRIK
jgi:hypothetical protein